MSRQIERVVAQLQREPKRWLVTGAAGFIGSNLVEFLLDHQQIVVGLDNFSTGYQRHLDEIQTTLAPEKWKNFFFIEGDICSFTTCQQVCAGIDHVLHQAALGSVPRSMHDPIATNAVNITGFLNMMVAGRDAKVTSFTYAASSSTYGDHPVLPKIEERIGKLLSPYAVTKYVNELYAAVFADVYGFETIGLRYFNVFGKRQNRHGAYVAVIPQWISSMIRGETVYINGDGENSRDFCFIENVIEANILAATAQSHAKNRIYNVALNERTSLNQLFNYLRATLAARGVHYTQVPIYRLPRSGDVVHSQADISKAEKYLGYAPQFKIQEGIEKAIVWYLENV